MKNQPFWMMLLFVGFGWGCTSESVALRPAGLDCRQTGDGCPEGFTCSGNEDGQYLCVAELGGAQAGGRAISSMSNGGTVETANIGGGQPEQAGASSDAAGTAVGEAGRVGIQGGTMVDRDDGAGRDQTDGDMAGQPSAGTVSGGGSFGGGQSEESRCDDGVQNGEETGIDCGGPCLGCAGEVCSADADCVTGFCAAGECTAVSCNDGIQNGDETGTDCGLVCDDADCDGTLSAEDCDDTNAASTTRASDADCDGVPTDEDCDDDDVMLIAKADDLDCDGAPNSVDPDADGDGIESAADCDDLDETRRARAQDFDCDGVLDAVDTDADGDGIESAADCDDRDDSRGARAEDLDCDGVLDAVDTDADGDGIDSVDDCDDRNRLRLARAADIDCDGDLNDADNDADGDGVAKADDCDDLNNMLLAKLADIDCDGELNDADNDADSDGVAKADDCDDLNNTRLAKVADVDCDGELNDADNDADGDGVAKADDCDDLNNTLLAKVADIDCDGELNDVDNDADGDGVAKADDCDDLNNTRLAKLADIDCDGALNDADNDADGDGVAKADDCNDLDNILLNRAADIDCDGELNARDADADDDGVQKNLDCDDLDHALLARANDVDCDGTLNDAPDCDDGLQAGDEVGMDCGGSCGVCLDSFGAWRIGPGPNTVEEKVYIECPDSRQRVGNVGAGWMPDTFDNIQCAKPTEGQFGANHPVFNPQVGQTYTPTGQPNEAQWTYQGPCDVEPAPSLSNTLFSLCDNPAQKQLHVNLNMPYPPVVGATINYEGECYINTYGFVPVGHTFDQANVQGTIAIPADRLCEPGDVCPPNFGCDAGENCLSGVCSQGACAAPQPDDNVLNGDETDVDCGGPTAPACVDGLKCLAGSDCVNRICAGGRCAVATDTDNVQNGDETDVDCGGTQASPCANGRTCGNGGDCVSGVCTLGICAVPSCDDQVANGDESDVDCGGVCGPCSDGRGCRDDTMCQSGHCTAAMKCAVTECGDGYVAVDEECDDANDDLTDGCSPACQILRADQCTQGCDTAGSVVGQSVGQIKKIVSLDTFTGFRFGHSVDIYGDTAVVGAIFSASNIGDVGAAHVFQYIAGEWRETQRLVPNDPQDGMNFGYAVAIHGDTIVVGAPYNAGRRGAAYVFEKQNGMWTQVDKLEPNQGDDTSFFGLSVDMSADALVVGAPFDGERGVETGAAYWFHTVNQRWTLRHKLTIGVPGVSGQLGFDVATSGDYVFAGAPSFNGRANKSGAVYVFTAASAAPLARLEAPSPDTFAQFGHCLSASGNTLAVGAPYDANDGGFTGAVFMFERFNQLWLFDQKLTATDRRIGHRFGQAVDLDGDTLIIGSLDNDLGQNSGAAYQFSRGAVDWIEADKLLAEDGGGGQELGLAVAVSNDIMLVGSHGDSTGGNVSGAAYLFGRSAVCASDGACICRPGYSDNDCGTYSPCEDEVRNGDESDIDCGGRCGGCTAGFLCQDAGDCDSGVCDANLCAAPTCDDGVQNGDERSADCGGVCGPCQDGSPCTLGAECLSGVCTGNLCAAPTCNDEVQNGDETNVDCGGPCPVCAIPNPDYANYEVTITLLNNSGSAVIEWADGQNRLGILANADPEPLVVNCGRPALNHGVNFQWTRVGDCIELPPQRRYNHIARPCGGGGPFVQVFITDHYPAISDAQFDFNGACYEIWGFMSDTVTKNNLAGTIDNLDPQDLCLPGQACFQ